MTNNEFPMTNGLTSKGVFTGAQLALKQARKKAQVQRLQRHFELRWRAAKGPELVTEHVFHLRRKWRFDYAHPASKVAIEIEGGIWSGGRHTRGKGYQEDCQKYNAAALLGWRVFRLTDRLMLVETLERIAALMRQNLQN